MFTSAVARTIRKKKRKRGKKKERKVFAVWDRASAGRANGDDYIRYSLCYNVILYLLNKTSN